MRAVGQVTIKVAHYRTTRYEWSRLFRRTLGRAADQRRRFRGLPAAPPLAFWTAASGAKLPLKMLFAAVHMSLNGTNATYGPRRPMSAVRSRTDSMRTVAFGDWVPRFHERPPPRSSLVPF